MVPIDPSVVDHVARLARLELTPEERELFTRQLASILDYCAKLNELGTEQVEPTSHVLPMTNVFREDVAGEPLSRDAVLAGAPEHEEGFLRVPPVIETESQP